MVPHSLRCLCLCLAVLITVSVHQSSCHQPFSRRSTPSFSAFSHHRFARRSSPRLSNHYQRSSIPINTSPSLTTSRGTSGPANHSRRSINLDQFDNDSTSQSLDQQRDEAERLWEEFVDADVGEDLDSYLDCDDDESAPALNTGSNDSPAIQPTSPSSQTSTGDKGKSAPTSNSQKQSLSKVQSNNYDEDEMKSGDQDQKASGASHKKEDEKAKEKAEAKAEAAKQQDADEATQNQKDQQAAQTKKDQDAAEAKKEQDAAEAKKGQDAAEAKKEQDAAEAKKEQDAAEAKKEQDAAEAKKEQEAAEEAQKNKKQKGEYQVTNQKKIPGTSVTTGTAKPKDENNYGAPSSEHHTGDATFFTPDTGACGVVNTSSDYIVAVSHLLYDSFPQQEGNPNTNAICHKKIRAYYNGRSVDVTVTDRCEGCDMYSLDFTESAFQELGSKDEGRLHGMTWTFI